MPEQSSDSPEPKIQRPRGRIVWWLLLLLALVLAVWVWPQTPVGRGWILTQVERTVAGTGYLLDYQQVEGNIWQGLSFSGVTLKGSGVDLELQRLVLGYQLFSLAQGRLPFTLKAEGLRGELTLSRLDVRSSAGRSSLPILPELRALELDDIDLAINDIPYTLPDLDLSDLKIRQQQDRFVVSGQLSSEQGRAEVEAEIGLNPFELKATTSHADLRLARHWWKGVEAGTAAGTVTVSNGDIIVDAEITGGATSSLLQLPISDVSGRVQMVYPLLEAELEALVFDRPVTASGGLDIVAKAWQVDVNGEAGFEPVLGWIFRNSLSPEQLDRLQVEGQGQLTLSLEAENWLDIRMQGQAQGEGSLLQRPLENVQVDLGYSRATGISAQVDAGYAGGAVDVAVYVDEGLNIDVEAAEVAFFDNLVLFADMGLKAQGGLAGAFTIGAETALLGESLQAQVVGVLTNHVWQGVLSGQGPRGSRLEGRLAYRDNQNLLQGDGDVLGLSLPYLSGPFDASIRVDGQLTDLPFTATISAAERLTLAVDPLALMLDLQGSLAGRLTNYRQLRDVRGQLGQLQLQAGQLDLRTLSGQLSYALAETAVSGVVEGQVGLTEGELSLQQGRLESSAVVVSPGLSVSALELPAFEALTSVGVAESWQLQAVDSAERFRLDASPEQLSAEVTALPLIVAAQPLLLTAEGSAATPDIINTLALTAELVHAAGSAQFQGTLRQAELRLALAPELLQLQNVALQVPLSLAGQVDVLARSVALAGPLGTLEARLEGMLGPADFRSFEADLWLLGQGQSLQLSAAGQANDLSTISWQTEGGLALAEAAALFGYQFEGQLTNSSLAGTGLGMFSGQAELELALAGERFSATLLGQAEQLAISAQRNYFGQELSLRGSLYPQLQAEISIADVGLVRVVQEADDWLARAEGTLPSYARQGLLIPAQTWQAVASLREASAQFSVGDSSGRFSWQDGWSLEADLQQRLSYQLAENRLIEADLSGRVSASDEQPRGSLVADVFWQLDSFSGRVAVSGSRDSIRAEGSLIADIARDLLGLSGFALAGELAFQAELEPDSLAYRLSADWQGAQLRLEGQGSELSASLRDESFSFIWDGASRLELSAEQARFDRFLSRPELPLSMSGMLSYDLLSEQWQGRLSVELERPVVTTVLLQGEGVLLASAGLVSDNYSITMNGQVWPEFAVQASASALDGLAEFSGQLLRDGLRFDLLGEVVTRAYSLQQPVEVLVPAQRFQAQLSLAGGLQALLQNEGSTLRLEQNQLSGNVGFAVLLEGLSHRVDATVAGPLAAPELSGTIQGDYVRGPFSAALSGVSADLELAPGPLIPANLATVDDALIQVALKASPNLSWQVALSGSATVQGIPLSLQSQASGQGAQYNASGTAQLSGGQVPFVLAGEGLDILASLELQQLLLAPISDIFGVPLTGSTSGTVRIGNKRGERPQVSLLLDVLGVVQTQTFEAELELEESARLRVQGNIAGVEVSLLTSLENLNRIDIKANGQLQGSAFELGGAVTLGEAVSLLASGSYQDQALSVSADWYDNSNGIAQLSWGEAVLRAEILRDAAQTFFARGTLNLPQSLLGLPPLDSSFALAWSQGQWSASELELSLRLQQGPLTLNVAGLLWPLLDVGGRVDASRLIADAPASVALSLKKQEAEYLLTLSDNGFSLGVYLDAALNLNRVTSQGELRLDSRGLVLDSQLSWQPQDGFAGTAQLSYAAAENIALEADLVGQGGLRARGQVSYPLLGTLLGADFDLLSSPAPWSDPLVEGRVSAQLNSQDFPALAAFDPLMAAVDLELSGSYNALEVAASVQTTGLFEATARLATTLTGLAWSQAALSGSLSAQLDSRSLLAPFVDLTSFAPLNAALSLELSGTLADPKASGSVSLTNLVEASGTLQADLQGLDLALAGEQLQLTTGLDRVGWQASGSVVAVDLLPWLSQLSAAGVDTVDLDTFDLNTATLSTNFLVSQNWQAALTLLLDELLISADQSTVAGRISWAEGLEASLQADIDLADVPLGPALRGRIAGPVGIQLATLSDWRSATLSGFLEASQLGLATSSWSLSGVMEVANTLASPDLSLFLNAEGSAQGFLKAVLQPVQAHYNFLSTLSLGPLVSDLELDIREKQVQASGSLSFADYRLQVEDASVDQQLRLIGQDRLAHWEVLLDLANSSLGVRGGLDSVNALLQGDVSLTASWRETTESWLSGLIENLRIATIPLGDIVLASSLEQGVRELVLRGEMLDAKLALTPAINWQVTRLALPLNDTVALQGQGQGQGSMANFEALLSATVLTETISLPLSLSYDEVLRLSSDSQLFGGSFSMAVALDPALGWQGSVSVQEAIVLATRVNVEGTLTGEPSRPALAATVSLERGSEQLRGEVFISRDEIRIVQRFDSDLIADTVTLEGSLFPKLALTLATDDDNQLSIFQLQQGLSSLGRFELLVSMAKLSLISSTEAGRWLDVVIALPAVEGLALETHLPALGWEAGWPADLTSLQFQGVGQTTGEVLLSLSPQLRLEVPVLSWRNDDMQVDLLGELSYQQGLRGSLLGQWQRFEGYALPLEANLPWLAELRASALSIDLQPQRFQLGLQNTLGTFDASYSLATRQFDLDADLSLGAGGGRARLSYGDEVSGELILEDVPLQLENVSLRIATDLDVTAASLRGRAEITTDIGMVQITGADIGWQRLLPPGWLGLLPLASRTVSADLRISQVEVGELAWVNARLPFLKSNLSSVINIRGERILGQVVSSGIEIVNSNLALSLELGGTVDAIDISGTLDRSDFTARYEREGNRLSGFVALERFPLHSLVEAIVGETNVTAQTTAALRFELPLDAVSQAEIRLASEQISLRRDTLETRGSLALNYADERLTLEEARFQGTGEWQASGVLARDSLNLNLEANNANFDALLGLIPRLALLGLGAQGSLRLQAQGSLSQPNISASSPSLAVQISGTRYRLDDFRLSLLDTDLTLAGQLELLRPLTGSSQLQGQAKLSLLPFSLSDTVVTAVGTVVVPAMGRLEQVDVRLSQAEEGWRVNGGGLLGQAFEVTGLLNPLNLSLNGQGLTLTAPRYFLVDSETDVALRLTRPDDFVLTGNVILHRAELSLEGRQALADAPTNNLELVNAAISEGVSSASNLAARRRLRFEDLNVSALQVRFAENFGSADLIADVRLSGNAAEPVLDGQAEAVRGSFRFSGRDFVIDQALARFNPNQGSLPELFIVAHASFDKERATGRSSIEFIEPSGADFEVFLQLEGAFSSVPGGGRRLNLDPTLSSNSLIRTRNNTRPLNEQELVSLITVGRIETNSALTSDTGFAGAAAQSALDTALDLILISELQAVLGDALGLDLFEIRTTSVSEFLAQGVDDGFGVSLRVGGYLSDDVFASYRVGRFNDPERRYALSNEFSLSYDLNQLRINLAGGINFLSDQITPQTDLSLSVGYALNQTTTIETGFELSNARQEVNFGLTFRW